MESLQSYVSYVLFYLHQYTDRYSFLFPLGVIGLWRWSVWGIKEVIGSHYKIIKGEYDASVSIVVPVYNENPHVFMQALESWEENKPSEIIAVIDYTDKTCIEIFKIFQKNFKNAHLIVTKTPGKRPALVEGIKKAKREIIALVDSDTIWSDDVIKNGLAPFQDNRVGGVATYQSVLNPKTFAQKIFDAQLDLRYMHEYPFLAASGDALVCLSGRTAFYRREALIPMLNGLVNETFMGTSVISGDDKFLTYQLLKNGWKTAYQANSHVYTPGMSDLKSYLKQRLRWTRNAVRADSKAMWDGWPRKHPALFFFQIDKILQSFVVILSLIFFTVALIFKQWIVAVAIFAWWFISRTVKMHSHFYHKPRRLTILPGYVVYSFLTGIIKIYSLFTLNTQGWITRWDKSRLPHPKLVGRAFAVAGTTAVLVILGIGVYTYKDYTFIKPHARQELLIARALPKSNSVQLAMSEPVVLGASTEFKKDFLVKKYKTTSGDSIAEIAKKFRVDANRLYYANNAKLPSRVNLPEGLILSIPGKDIYLDPTLNTNSNTSTASATLNISYDSDRNTILVSGRGTQTTLKEIQQKVGTDKIEKTADKEWLLKANIFLYQGTTLKLDKKEVEWLKLESNKDRFVVLRSSSADILINGVKITSWDDNNDDFDKEMSDGRAFIMVKDNARMDLYNSEIAYLGFPTSPNFAVSPYGISWRVGTAKLKKVLITGEIVNSKFHHLYFGAYTFGATGMTWRGNEFYENVRYGLDPHDDSNGFIIEKNYAHHNGTHGIILSKRCMYNVIRNNISINNKLHGIMLHEKSNYNIVENNEIGGNVSGVAIWRSSNNIVRNNIIEDNKHGIRANADSQSNLVENNKISDSKSYGIYVYDNSNHNIIRSNSLEKNRIAVYVKSNTNQILNNSLVANGVGIYFLDTASNNTITGNKIEDSDFYAIYTKVQDGLVNVLGVNTLERNRKDTDGQVFN